MARAVRAAIIGGMVILILFCYWHSTDHIQEGLVTRANARACGCDPWSEHCVVPPHDSPGYGCIRSFDDHDGNCGDAPQPNDGPWVQWGFGHGHPLTAGHTEEETKKIATAVFGADSDITRQLHNEAIRRDARAQEQTQGKPGGDVALAAPDSDPDLGVVANRGSDSGSGSGSSPNPADVTTPDSGSGSGPVGTGKKVPEQGDALKTLPDVMGSRDLSLHPNPPKPAIQCGTFPEGGVTAAQDTANAVYADPVTTYTDMPVHLPTSQDLRPYQTARGGRCGPSVTGIFQVCGPLAAGV